MEVQVLSTAPSLLSMTIAEKILATKSGKSSVMPGEIVEAYPDLVMSHTATWRSVSVMQKIGATKLYDPNRLAIVLDHIAPAKTPDPAHLHSRRRAAAVRLRLRRCPSSWPPPREARRC